MQPIIYSIRVSILIMTISFCEIIVSQDNRPYNYLKHGSEVCDGTTNQTNRLNHQQRQDSTVHIYNNIRKTQIHSKKILNDDRNIKTLNMTMTNYMIYGLTVLNL